MEEYPFPESMGKTKFVPREDSPVMNVKFSPGLFLQRYSAVLSYLTAVAEKEDVRVVTEYGPNNCSFLYQALQRTSWLEQIHLVDVDAEVVSGGYASLREPHCNRTDRERRRKLTATFYVGNIADSDRRVSHSDAVIGIELIEHLTAVDFAAFPRNVFGRMQPKHVVFTTPNSDFNVLFGYERGRFRHPDHKFEFSRAECRRWAESVVDAYPAYRFRIYGVGAPPESVEADVGFATQMVVFERVAEPAAPCPSVESYKLVGEIAFHCGDDRTPEQRHLAKVAQSSATLLCELFRESTRSVYMRQERCAEGHWMDVVPVATLVGLLAKKDLVADADTVVEAVREHSSTRFDVEMTIALGAVFVDQCDCDSQYHEQDPVRSATEAPAPLLYALSAFPYLGITRSGWVRGNAGPGEIYVCVEQFLHAAALLREFLLVSTRDGCAVQHSMSFVTPAVVVAHLQANGIETDVETVLQFWRQAGIKKFPLEATSFGYAILVENVCGEFPCKSDAGDDSRWDDEYCCTRLFEE